jgi:hypothetical protein
MTTPDPSGPAPDDSPTAPVDLPPLAPTSPAEPPPLPGPPPVEPPQFATAPPPSAPPPSGPPPFTTDAAKPSWTVGARPRETSQPGQPGLVAGIVLVVIGAVFLVVRVIDITFGASSWPLWIIVPGLAMLAGSLAIPSRAGLGLAIPGAMIAIVGGILWVQDANGIYGTWAYAWALVAPTGPGLAMLVHGLTRGDRPLIGDGFRTTLVGLALFIGFGIFFEGVIGISGHRIANLDEVLPYIVIGFGILLVVGSLFGGGNRRDRPRA